MSFKKLYIWSVVWVLFLQNASSQTFNFRNFDINDGLPQSYVYALQQDQDGFLWVGTGEGLCRFDGRNFRTFKISDGLAENFITASHFSPDGIMWTGHYHGGISYFNGTDFKHLPTGAYATSSITGFADLPDKTLLASTQASGLVLVGLKSGVHHIELPEERIITSIRSFANGEILIGTNEGLLLCKLEKKEIIVLKEFLNDVQVLNISPAKENSAFWISTGEEGIYKYRQKSKNPLQKVSIPLDFAEQKINLTYEDRDGNLWLSFLGEGIHRLYNNDDGYEKAGHYTTSSGLSSDYVRSILEDREGNIWIGTVGGGLDQLMDPVFTLYTHKDGLPSDDIAALYLDDQQQLWLGCENKLVGMVGGNKVPEVVFELPNETSSNSFEITSICEDDSGDLLLGTVREGVWKYSRKDKIAEKFFYSSHNLLHNRIKGLSKDKNGNIWIATEEGVFNYRSKDKSFKHLTMEDGLAHNNVFYAYPDNLGYIWFATHGTGLSCFLNDSIINHPSPIDTRGIETNCFARDKDGNLWIGTYGQGIFIFDGKEFVYNYTAKDGLVSNYCYSIHADRNGNIWVGHKTGISKFLVEKNTFSKYQKKEGFLVEGVNSHSIIEDQSNIYFGTGNGLLKYNFRADKTMMAGPLISLSDISLFFKKTDWNQFSKNVTGLARLPQNLVLPHNKNHLTFSVSGISLTAPDKVKYQYKLEGFDSEWSLITNEDFITYSNIPPGDYTFKAMAVNNMGVNSKAVSFEFSVSSPFWKTWWFMILTATSGLGLMAMFVKVRTDNLRKQREVLQEEKSKLLSEIRVRKRAERKQKISEEKLKQTNKELNLFIYKSSHDIRGPLKSVKGLTELGKMELKERLAHSYLNMINDSVDRLDAITKNLIEIVEMTEADIDSCMVDFNQLVASVIEDGVEQECAVKNIKIDVTIEVEKEFYNDFKLLHTILKNIIDNSIFFYNPERPSSYIKIRIATYRNGIIITVSDNGLGIDKSVQDRCFEMFYRGSSLSKGSGLGLYVVQKIATRLEGFVKLDSNLNEGTSIDIYIPNLK
ncbi:two-component regulator propeller domain-containing protein [Cytophagaceae bacterium ABcell3]|nr:two-component regulator propeller domain-containing protein [Cytophagaceae bacterium ABcell3]